MIVQPEHAHPLENSLNPPRAAGDDPYLLLKQGATVVFTVNVPPAQGNQHQRDVRSLQVETVRQMPNGQARCTFALASHVCG